MTRYAELNGRQMIKVEKGIEEQERMTKRKRITYAIADLAGWLIIAGVVFWIASRLK